MNSDVDCDYFDPPQGPAYHALIHRKAEFDAVDQRNLLLHFIRYANLEVRFVDWLDSRLPPLEEY